MGSKDKDKHNKDRIKKGRGTVGKTTIIGVKNRKTNKIKAKVVMDTTKLTLQGFIDKNVERNPLRNTPMKAEVIMSLQTMLR